VQATGANTVSATANLSDVSKDDTSLKRKRPSPPPAKDDPKLKEFLSIMQAPSKSKSWKNDDFDGTQEEKEEISAKSKGQEKKVLPADDESDDEYQAISKKQKRLAVHASIAGNLEESEEPMDFKSKDQSSVPEVGVQDDSNWLKSKTGQLLGLDGDEEKDANAISRPRRRSSSAESAVKRVETDANDVDAADTPPTPIEEIDEQPMDDVEKQIRNSKRLFLRNLPFTITEEALVDSFSTFGQVEEVCARSLS
jgi:multiple RNA-binding domain-containing protein 1